MRHVADRFVVRCAVVSALLLAPGAARTLPDDSPFVDATFEQAQARALAESRILVADFSATWCGPCKRMEKEVWPAENVRAWLKDHAIAVRVDVDQERDLSHQLKIEAMPTMIAFKDGKEFD